MTTRRTRRTVRSAALVAVAAAAAFSLTACQGGGNVAASGTEKNVSASVSVSGSGSGSASDGGASSGAKTGTGKDTTGTQDTAATGAASGTKSSPIRTETLVDGSKAEVYKTGEDYLAKIVNNGSVLATLQTKGHDDGVDANDMFVVLTMGGEVKSWMGGGDQGPGTFVLEGGWQAEVSKVGDLKYRAEILGREGDVEATLETNGHDVGLDANGSYIVLSAGGVISSHM
ncbi:hypothetical protein [Streptomyces sp. NPDC006012]|uniref:hypothetical protein n=1 Tax=Streptomyces sp. NPDC006012 TaxID=3364739 RepID=UPI0036AA7193